MTGQGSAELVLGCPASFAPFLAERVAVDLTALLGAEKGLVALRERTFLHRLWDDLTGQTQEKATAVGSHILAFQRACFEVVQTIMKETIRSRSCILQVQSNVHQIIQNIDELQVRDQVKEEFVELRNTLRSEVGQLVRQVDVLRRDLTRETMLRQLQVMYEGKKLHPGIGPLLGSALYLGFVMRLFADEPGGMPTRESEATLAVIEKHVGDVIDFVPTMLARDVICLKRPALETVEYLADVPSASLLKVVVAVAQGLQDHGATADDAMLTAEQTFRQLPRYPTRPVYALQQPRQVVEHLSKELLEPSA